MAWSQAISGGAETRLETSGEELQSAWSEQESGFCAHLRQLVGGPGLHSTDGCMASPCGALLEIPGSGNSCHPESVIACCPPLRHTRTASEMAVCVSALGKDVAWSSPRADARAGYNWCNSGAGSLGMSAPPQVLSEGRETSLCVPVSFCEGVRASASCKGEAVLVITSLRANH